MLIQSLLMYFVISEKASIYRGSLVKNLGIQTRCKYVLRGGFALLNSENIFSCIFEVLGLVNRRNSAELHFTVAGHSIN